MQSGIQKVTCIKGACKLEAWRSSCCIVEMAMAHLDDSLVQKNVGGAVALCARRDLEGRGPKLLLQQLHGILLFDWRASRRCNSTLKLSSVPFKSLAYVEVHLDTRNKRSHYSQPLRRLFEGGRLTRMTPKIWDDGGFTMSQLQRNAKLTLEHPVDILRVAASSL